MVECVTYNSWYLGSKTPITRGLDSNHVHCYLVLRRSLVDGDIDTTSNFLSLSALIKITP